MPQLINWALLREPVNWIIVALMLAIAAAGLHLLLGDHDAGYAANSGSTTGTL